MGTRYPFYNFRHTKYACLFGVLLSCHLTVLSLIYKLLSRMFLPWIMELPTDEAFTKGMVLVLARLATQLPLIPVGILLAKAAFFPIRDEECLQRIMAYKITHSLPPEKKAPADIAYNMNIVKDINTGKTSPSMQRTGSCTRWLTAHPEPARPPPPYCPPSATT